MAWSREYTNRKFEELRASFGNKCFDCGLESNKNPVKPNLQFAHLKPTGLNGMGRGKIHRYYDIKKNRDCYTLACFTCHLKLDNPAEEPPPF